MQAVRLLKPHPKNLWWKWKEAIKAVKMERAKSKEWIISQYLNRAPFGSNFVGIEAASQGWFGKSTKEGLEKLDEQTFLDVFDGVPSFTIAKDQLGQGIIEVLTAVAPVNEEQKDKVIFPSKGECRKMIQGGGVSLNKEKVSDLNQVVSEADLIDGKYLLAQRGKKNYYLITVK